MPNFVILLASLLALNAHAFDLKKEFRSSNITGELQALHIGGAVKMVKPTGCALTYSKIEVSGTRMAYMQLNFPNSFGMAFMNLRYPKTLWAELPPHANLSNMPFTQPDPDRMRFSYQDGILTVEVSECISDASKSWIELQRAEIQIPADFSRVDGVHYTMDSYPADSECKEIQAESVRISDVTCGGPFQVTK